MELPHIDQVVVQQKISQLSLRDEIYGQRASQREKQRQLDKYGAIRQYEFPPNTTQVHITDWVHKSWLRPVRFAYRNMPRPLRRLMKKLTS